MMRMSDQAQAVRNEAERAPPAPPPEAATGPERQTADEALLAGLIHALGDPPIGFELWNGRRVRAAGAEPIATIRLPDRRALLKLVWHPTFEFAEGYSDGTIGFEGDLVEFVAAMNRASAGARHKVHALRTRMRAWRGPARNSLDASRDNVHRHYDIGNEFYALWLGRTMAYTCAYYPTPTATLDEAQVAKMDLVCRKLRLSAGETVIEAGCGWGSLALHMAERYGVTVRSFNISREQLDWARHQARAAGLGGRVEFIEDDYRNITGRCDAFVSVGMLEHVGPDRYAELGRVANDALGGRGRGLIHSIGRNYPKPFDGWIAARIFPGAYPPSLREMMEIFEPWNLSVLDVENLRLHYARTLRDWLALFEASRDKVAAMFDERFVRMWRLYLSGSVAAFLTGELQLFQVLFAPGRSNDVPLTRADIYR